MASKSKGPLGGFIDRDVAWRTYEVLKAHPDLPPVGATFRSWPWGTHFHQTEGLKTIVVDGTVIADYVNEGFAKIIAPARLADKPVEKEAGKAAA